MPVSKKDAARVLAGEKRHRAWKQYVQANPAVVDPCDKNGVRKQVRANFVRGNPDKGLETIDREKAVRSGGITPDVTLRSADSKFVRHQREFSGQIMQGKVQVSTIDGHVYGSIQKVGRSLEEYIRDEGYAHPDTLIGGKGSKPRVMGKREGASPFKRRWKDSTFVTEIKKG